MSSNPFDPFGGVFGHQRSTPPPPNERRPEKGVPWAAKVIDGVYYVPLSQVADLLRENEVLPAVRKGIERRVEGQS